MALPKLEANRFKCKLPITGNEIEYRAFLVKEQKVLLTALESEDAAEVNRSIIQLIKSCIFSDSVIVDKLPITDLEYLFIQLRIKSVGETSNVNIPCSECEHPNEVVIDLQELDVSGEVPNNDISIRDNIVMRFRQPSLNDVPENLNAEDLNAESIFEVIRNCVEMVTYGDEVFTNEDFSKSELQEFIDQFTGDEFQKIQDYFERLPKIKHDLKFRCSNCNTDNEIELSGMQDFFG